MYEEIYKELINIFNESSMHEEYVIDNNIFITADKAENENKINIVIEYKKDDFEEYIDSLDEDIFVEACSKFEDITGEQLSNDTDPDKFKSVVNKVIQQKIENLKSFLTINV